MKKLLLIPAIAFFAGCANVDNMSLDSINPFSNQGVCESEPSWVLNPPSEKGFVYGVGVAPKNFNGEQAQRKSALAKAINEIASQLNTTVNSQVATSMSMHNGQGSHSMSSVSFQTVNGQKVRGKIIKSCKNPNNGYLYILMRARGN